MKKYAFVILAFMLNVQLTLGQDIRGRVVDAQNLPLEFVNVSLLSKQDSSVVAGTATDNDGTFTIKCHQRLADVIIKASFIGYNTLYLEAKTDLGNMVLSESENVLNEVTVKANRPSFRMNNGKLKVNVANTILANTGNAIEVLSFVPFVSRAGDGVSVFGRGTPTIYIDNRKVNDLSELQKIQSNEIKSIETDLHPGAAYGSDVHAVIRIALVNHEEGLSGTVIGQAYQTKHTNGMGYARLNYRSGRWDVFGGFSSTYNRKASATDNELSFDSNDTQIDVLQQFNNKYKTLSLNPELGFDYSDNGKNDFGLKYSFTRYPDTHSLIYGTSTTTLNNASAGIANTSLDNNNSKSNHSVNAYYTTTWDKENTLFLSVDFLNGKSNEQYSSVWDGSQTVTSASRAAYNLLIAKASLSHPVWGGTLSYGTEWSFTHHKQSYETLENSLAEIVGSNDKNQQTLGAIFISQSKEIGKFSAEVGLRMEYADYRYNQDNIKDAETSKKYFRLLPSVEVDYDADDFSLSLSYDNAIHRPSYSQLNSSTVYVDKYTYQRGNPLLQPAYDYILDFVATWKDLSFDISHTWYVDRILQTYSKTASQSAVVFQTNNIPHYREWGATISYLPSLGFWRPKAEVSVFKQSMTYHEQTYNKPYFTYELDNVFRLTSHINLTFDLWGTARGHQYLSDMKPTFRADCGVNASFCKNKLGLWLKVTDLMNTDKEWWSCNINNIRFSKTNYLDTRGIMLQLRYSFNPQRNKYKGTSPFGGEVQRL